VSWVFLAEIPVPLSSWKHVTRERYKRSYLCLISFIFFKELGAHLMNFLTVRIRLHNARDLFFTQRSHSR
jgi:uncharacterized membrane protein